MKITNAEEFSFVKYAKKSLESLLSELEDSKSTFPELGELLNVELLNTWKNTLDESMNEYNNGLISEVTSLIKPGNIVKVSGGDGLSFTEMTYYDIKDIINRDGNVQILCDTVYTMSGDYGKSLTSDTKIRVDFEELKSKMLKSYHCIVTDIEEYDNLVNLSKTLPEISWKGIF